MPEVAWQVAALRAGFAAAVDGSHLLALQLSGEELAEALCGPDDAGLAAMDVRQTFRLVLDSSLAPGGASQPLADALWQVLETWPVPLRRRFLLFVTGSERLPPTGTELLKVELPFVALGAGDLREQLGMLPQAHTCENVLELPDYFEAVRRVEGLDGEAAARRCCEVLDDRLQLAVSNCSSYGLDEQ
jgi:hypothetical protein